MSAWKELQLARTDIKDRERAWKTQCRMDWESDMRAWDSPYEDEPVCCDECKYWADGICSLSEEETNDDESCRWGVAKGADDETRNEAV